VFSITVFQAYRFVTMKQALNMECTSTHGKNHFQSHCLFRIHFR